MKNDKQEASFIRAMRVRTTSLETRTSSYTTHSTWQSTREPIFHINFQTWLTDGLKMKIYTIKGCG